MSRIVALRTNETAGHKEERLGSSVSKTLALRTKKKKKQNIKKQEHLKYLKLYHEGQRKKHTIKKQDLRLKLLEF